MVIFKWYSNLELGIELIDQQHKQIIEYANSFFISYKCGGSHSKMSNLLNFLTQYVLYHFQAEEAFQVECRYPDYRAHQAAHNMLRTQLKFHSTKLFDSHFCGEDVDRFYDFLREWVINHILTDDSKFAAYYRSEKHPEV